MVRGIGDDDSAQVQLLCNGRSIDPQDLEDFRPCYDSPLSIWRPSYAGDGHAGRVDCVLRRAGAELGEVDGLRINVLGSGDRGWLPQQFAHDTARTFRVHLGRCVPTLQGGILRVVSTVELYAARLSGE